MSWETERKEVRVEIYRKEPINLKDFPTAKDIIKIAEESGFRGNFLVYVDDELIEKPENFPTSGTVIKIVPEDVWG